MKYIDLHCDTLTECARKGANLFDCSLQTSVKRLKAAGCAAQCFAVFTEGENAMAEAEEYFSFYESQKRTGGFLPVLNYADLEKCLRGEAFGSILTVENLGFTDGDINYIERLAGRGVKMASLVWNNQNAFAYPNLINRGGKFLFEERERRGLSAAGIRAVERLDELKIIVDISHLSDGGARDILRGRKIPVAASHSNAAEVCNVSRNLTDDLIKGVADCGGVIGVNFCKNFVGEGNIFEGVYRHISHIIKIGGEDVIALGSDFDGIPAPKGLESCDKMPALFNYLSGRLGGDVMEKLVCKNFTRVFKEVCG